VGWPGARRPGGGPRPDGRAWQAVLAFRASRALDGRFHRRRRDRAIPGLAVPGARHDLFARGRVRAVSEALALRSDPPGPSEKRPEDAALLDRHDPGEKAPRRRGGGPVDDAEA